MTREEFATLAPELYAEILAHGQQLSWYGEYVSKHTTLAQIREAEVNVEERIVEEAAEMEALKEMRREWLTQNEDDEEVEIAEEHVPEPHEHITQGC